MKISEMRQKEVINISDGARLGFVYDVEFNIYTGMLEFIVVPGNKSMGFFAKNEDFTIPWKCIKKIGDDIILIEFEGN